MESQLDREQMNGQTDISLDRDIDGQSYRWRDKHTGCQFKQRRLREKNKYGQLQTGGQTGRQTDGRTDGRLYIQIDKQISSWTDEQSDRLT